MNHCFGKENILYYKIITLYFLPFSSVQKSVYVNPCNCAPVQCQNYTEVMFTSSYKNVGLFILRVFSQL
uniref:Uncharacterized protein n=1 Tax=Anguilla anguilla TaxID=7936 RepID=A0A0E9RSW3_ANGAN